MIWQLSRIWKIYVYIYMIVSVIITFNDTISLLAPHSNCSKPIYHYDICWILLIFVKISPKIFMLLKSSHVCCQFITLQIIRKIFTPTMLSHWLTVSFYLEMNLFSQFWSVRGVEEFRITWNVKRGVYVVYSSSDNVRQENNRLLICLAVKNACHLVTIGLANMKQ